MKFVAVWTEKLDSHLSTDEGLGAICGEEECWKNHYPFHQESEMWGKRSQSLLVNSYYTLLKT